MLLTNLKFSEYTTLDVQVIDDYHQRPTFAHDAVCDIEYYGYRETDYKVVKAYGHDKVGTFEFEDHEIQRFVAMWESDITRLVQDAIDEHEGFHEQA